MDFEKLSFVLAGELRKQIIKELETPKSPLQLTKSLKRSDSSISRTLRELEENEIIQNMFPEKKKGRLYQLTKHGKEILRNI